MSYFVQEKYVLQYTMIKILDRFNDGKYNLYVGNRASPSTFEAMPWSAGCVSEQKYDVQEEALCVYVLI